MNLRLFQGKAWSAVLASSLILSQGVPLAQAIPHAYWQYQVPFQSARDSGDFEALIPIALAIEEIMVQEPDDQSTREILYGVYEQLALAYEARMDYPNTVQYLEKQIQYAVKLGYDDAIIIAEKRILQLNPLTEVYALSQNLWQLPNYGAIHEPASGVYFGRTYGNEAALASESAISFYVECLQESVSQYDYLIAPADDGTRLLQICLNMPQEADSLRAVMDSSSNEYLLNTMQYLAGLKSPVLLRIGGEMNVFANACTPEEFKAAYIKIAQYARDNAPNVALVFSPNSISSWGMSYLDYYPGDEWVDWVGLSAYTHLYYNAYDPYGTEDYQNMFYGTGDYADPIRNLQEIVETFGDRKPIIISESGSGYVHNHLPELNNSLQAFSEEQITKLYTYANMVYPQIKAIISFDQVMDEEYHFAPSANWGVWTNYLAATEDNASLISSVKNQNTLGYLTAGDYSDNLETLSLAAFSSPVGVSSMEVRYVLDGNTVHTSSSMPYSYDLSVGSISAGTHSLEVQFHGDKGFSEVKYYSLEKGEGNAVTLRESSEAVAPGTSETPLPESTETPQPDSGETPDSTVTPEAGTVVGENLGTMAQYSSDLGKISGVDSNTRMISGALPLGLGIYPDGTLGGIPKQAGEFSFVLSTSSGDVAYHLTVESQETADVTAGNHREISIPLPTVDSNESRYSLTVAGDLSSLQGVYLDGVLLLSGVDYELEGSAVALLPSMMSQLAAGKHTVNLCFSTGAGGVSSGVQVAKLAQSFEKTVGKSDSSALPFGDVSPSDWYYNPVVFMYKRSIVSGTTATSFSPNEGMSRAMVAVMLYAVADRPETGESSVGDVESGQWYSNAIHWLVNQGIADNSEEFRPYDLITREETAYLLYQFAVKQGIALPLATSKTASDLDAVSAEAKEAVMALFGQGIFAGDTSGNFNPNNTANRGEVSTIMNNFLGLLG